jgi:hypothetical protein
MFGARFAGVTEALPPFEFPFTFPGVARLLGVLVLLPWVTMLSAWPPVATARSLGA